MLENKCGDDDVADSAFTPLSEMDEFKQQDEGFIDKNDVQTVGLVSDTFP